MQAPRFERLSFGPFPLLQDGFVASKVDVRRRDVVEALVEALMVVVVNEGFAPPDNSAILLTSDSRKQNSGFMYFQSAKSVKEYGSYDQQPWLL
jgi:hypothetical protein